MTKASVVDLDVYTLEKSAVTAVNFRKRQPRERTVKCWCGRSTWATSGLCPDCATLLARYPRAGVSWA